MDTTIILSIAALLASGIAFAVNLYLLLARQKARWKILLGDRLTFSYSPDNHLRFSTSIVFTNEGANVGTIARLHGTIMAHTGESIGFVWRNFISTGGNGSTGDEYKPSYSFSGWANAIVVPAQSAKVCEVMFSTVEAFQLKEGDYMMELVLVDELQNKAMMRLSQQFSCSRKNVESVNRQRKRESFDSAERALRAKFNLAPRPESMAVPNAPETTQGNDIKTPPFDGTDTHVMCSHCGHVNDAKCGYCVDCGTKRTFSLR